MQAVESGYLVKMMHHIHLWSFGPQPLNDRTHGLLPNRGPHTGLKSDCIGMQGPVSPLGMTKISLTALHEHWRVPSNKVKFERYLNGSEPGITSQTPVMVTGRRQFELSHLIRKFCTKRIASIEPIERITLSSLSVHLTPLRGITTAGECNGMPSRTEGRVLVNVYLQH
jgi:hypothetical protein